MQDWLLLPECVDHAPPPLHLLQTPQAEQAPQAASANFGLRPGIAVEVLTAEDQLSFVGRVDSLRGDAVIIRESKGDELPPVMYNKEVKLRYFRDTGNVVLRGKICGSTALGLFPPADQPPRPGQGLPPLLPGGGVPGGLPLRGGGCERRRAAHHQRRGV